MLSRWFHGWRAINFNQNPNQNNAKTLGVSCETHLKCKGEDICRIADDKTWCVPSCPAGYSLRTLYEDFDISEETYTKSIHSQIFLKTCVKDA